MEQQNPTFDSRFILTIVLVGVVWMGWQSYLEKKYPSKRPVAPTKVVEEKTTAKNSLKGNDSATSTPDAPTETAETVLNFSNPTWSFVVSSRGMAIRDVVLSKYTTRADKNVTFANGSNYGLFSTWILGQNSPINFSIRQENADSFVGEARIGAMVVTKRIQVNTSNYTFKTEIDVTNPNSGFKGLVTEISDKIPPAASGFLKGRFNRQEFFVDHDGKTSRTLFTPTKGVSESYSKTIVAGYGSQYFATAVLDRSQIMPDLQIHSELGVEPTAVGTLTYQMFNPAQIFKISYTGFAGPKSYDLLNSISPDMTGLVNFGFFQTIGKWIFWLMKLIHSVIPNWGWVIIVLTFLVRLAVAPFTILSYKQMKAMARIQPQIKALRERYKDDSQRLNQEMLQLMKANKANPVGGCLPMFLQIPIFFALYEVIGQSIELYKAPFIFWIHDLSAKDPYYIIPVLMGVAMWAQQKITPNTMDPSQQKLMMFMPIIFTAMCVQLPSGLTLYIFVSSLFGFVQQYFTMKENKQLSVVHA